MYNYQDTVSYAISSFFFVFVVILGAFVTVNLVLASIMYQFIQTKLRKKEDAAAAALEKEKEIKLA